MLTIQGVLFTVFTMNDNQRDRILACACDLYLGQGLEGFSMRKLARAVGVTAPAIYRHFDGREAVLADVLREAHRTFSRYLYGALAAPTPLERFLGAGEGFLDFVLDHPRWYGIMHTPPEHLGMEALPGDIEALQAAIHQFWVDRVRECMQAGVLKSGEPEEASVTMWAHAHGLVQLYHHGCLATDPDEFRALFKASSARLMAGVATEDFARELSENALPNSAQLAR
jgi:AcrR family transcriptional regulator